MILITFVLGTILLLMYAVLAVVAIALLVGAVRLITEPRTILNDFLHLFRTGGVKRYGYSDIVYFVRTGRLNRPCHD